MRRTTACLTWMALFSAPAFADLDLAKKNACMVCHAVGKKVVGLLVGVCLLPQAWAQPALFKEADLKLGEQLIAEHQCVACHARRVGGDGSAIYKPLERVNTPAFLRGMVEQCNTELNLGMFPEDVTAVAAVLNRDHYQFK